MRTWRLALAVVALLSAACGSGMEGAPRLARGTLPPDPGATSTPTSTATEASTTAPAPPATGPGPTAPPDAVRPSTPAGLPGAVVSPRGVVVPVVGGGPSRWKVHTPCGATATVVGGQPIGATTVVLDPGHGGAEPGATAPSGLRESTVNLAVAGYTAEALRRAGTPAVLTRTADYQMALVSRAEVATALHPRAFVSIHHNAEPDGPWPRPGTETYYQIASPDSKRLAGLIYEEVVGALSQYQVAWVADRDAGAKYRLNDRGGDYYAMLRRPAPVTSVLAELGFISNPPEAALYGRPDVQRVEGEAVARGIERYLTTHDPGSGFVTPYPRTEPAGGPGPATCRDPAL